MAVPFNIVRVNAVPASPAPNTLYITKDTKGRAVLTFIGNTAASRASTLTTADVQTLISEALANAGAVYAVDTLAALQAIVPTTNSVGFVRNPIAPGDPVSYVYDLAKAGWKPSQAPAKWADIVGRPASSAAQIDAAVTASHTHTNMAVLDKLGQSVAGKLTYNGSDVSEVGFASDW